MVGKSKPASAAEKKRMSLIKREAWCIPCILNFTPDRPATTIQHVVDGYRLGHSHSYGCCGWHHQAILENEWTVQDMLRHFGPSLAHGSKDFARAWAKEADLVKLLDYLIGLYDEFGPWMSHNMPRQIGQEVRRRCDELKGLR